MHHSCSCSQPLPLCPALHLLPPGQVPLLDKAALRLLQGPEFEGLRAQMQQFRTDNPWVEQSALFRWALRGWVGGWVGCGGGGG